MSKRGGKTGIWTPKIFEYLQSEDYPGLRSTAEIGVDLDIPEEVSVNSCLQGLRKKGLVCARKPNHDERPDMTRRDLNLWEFVKKKPQKLPLEPVVVAEVDPDPQRQTPQQPEPEQPKAIQPDAKICPSCGAPRARMMCNGSGATLKQKKLWADQDVLYDVHQICPFKVALKVRQGMDPSIREVPHYVGASTPLVREGHPWLLFERSWQVVARNTQNFILNQPDPMNYVVRVTSDREILEVRLGNQTEEDTDTRLSLSAFMRPPHLVVIRLGELGYPNKAAGGYLYEAIITRIRDNKRTWVQCPPSNPYRPEHLSWDASLNHLFDTMFKRDAKLKSDRHDRGVL